MNNTCICCGTIVPEGRQICPQCEDSLKNYKPKGVKTKKIKKFKFIQLTIDDVEVNNDKS